MSKKVLQTAVVRNIFVMSHMHELSDRLDRLDGRTTSVTVQPTGRVAYDSVVVVKLDVSYRAVGANRHDIYRLVNAAFPGAVVPANAEIARV